MVLPSDLDILALPSSPMMRRVGVSSGCGSGKEAFAEARVPPARGIARELEVLHLVFTNRHLVCAIQQDVRGLQHRIHQQPGRNALHLARPCP